MGHTSGALAPRNSAGCVRRRLYVIFLFTFDWRGSDPTPVGCQAYVTLPVIASSCEIESAGPSQSVQFFPTPVHREGSLRD